MRVHLDNCCYNRPFDDQRILTTALETFAKLQSYTKWRQGQFEDMSLDELAQATRESGEAVRASEKARQERAVQGK